jgi:hypothetical protein
VRFKSPYYAVLALGLVCAALALFVNLRAVLEVANVFTLTWYNIVPCDALMLPKDKRVVWPRRLPGSDSRRCRSGPLSRAARLAVFAVVRWLVTRLDGLPGSVRDPEQPQNVSGQPDELPCGFPASGRPCQVANQRKG